MYLAGSSAQFSFSLRETTLLALKLLEITLCFANNFIELAISPYRAIFKPVCVMDSYAAMRKVLDWKNFAF